jgi:hypothetical protein
MRTLLPILFLCATVHAAGEIQAFAPGVTTTYAVVRQSDGDVWYVTGQVFEAWGTGARTAADYALALTDKSGDMFVGDFDAAIPSGDYIVSVHYQTGASPADADPVVWIQEGTWDGVALIPGVNVTRIHGDLIAEPNVAGYMPAIMEWGSDGVDVARPQLLPYPIDVQADGSVPATDWADGERLDLILDAIKAMTDLMAVQTTTIASVDANDPNERFTLTEGKGANDVYTNMALMVEDATDSHSEVRWIAEYSTGREVLLDEPLSFTPEAADKAWILGPVYGGWMQSILENLNESRSPIYIYPRAGTSSGGGNVTHFLQDGTDP